jgi:hypothetical protein
MRFLPEAALYLRLLLGSELTPTLGDSLNRHIGGMGESQPL